MDRFAHFAHNRATKSKGFPMLQKKSATGIICIVLFISCGNPAAPELSRSALIGKWSCMATIEQTYSTQKKLTESITAPFEKEIWQFHFTQDTLYTKVANSHESCYSVRFESYTFIAPDLAVTASAESLTLSLRDNGDSLRVQYPLVRQADGSYTATVMLCKSDDRKFPPAFGGYPPEKCK